MTAVITSNDAVNTPPSNPKAPSSFYQNSSNYSGSTVTTTDTSDTPAASSTPSSFYQGGSNYAS